jgi:hypothetical protein
VALAWGYGWPNPAIGAVAGAAKQPEQDRPDDRPREHVEAVERSPHGYAVEFRGTVDGTMTRMPVGYAAYYQGWQPNRSVVIENLGPTDVRNPQVVVNGKRNWRSVADYLAEAARGYTTTADRARAIWEFRRRHRFHATTWDGESSDALKSLHVYGYTLCGDEAVVLNDLWKIAGLTTRRGYPVGHCVTEVLLDGAYHLLDGDEHVLCLKRDNRTIASEADVVRDHDLLKRTHSYGILNPESRETDEFSASLYGYEGERTGDHGMSARHAMDLLLRPGESIEFRWDHAGKQYTAGAAPAPGQPIRDGMGDLLAGWGSVAYDRLVNGRMRYRPDLSRPEARQGVNGIDNALFDGPRRAIRPQNPKRPAKVVWVFACPYVYVGGKATAAVRLAPGASAEWSFSADGQNWQKVVAASEAGTRELAAGLDKLLSPRGRPMYRFWLQLILHGDAAAERIGFDSEVQMAPLALPELEVGANRIEYRDATGGPRRVRIKHRWIERTAWHPPQAPKDAVSPPDGREVPGSRVTFRWSSASDPDGDRIDDYHFELSEHADMRWPLSPNFERLISLTPSQGKEEWTAPYAGLLNSGTPYYWRVRARDATGVWGKWSRTFSFRVAAPAAALDVRLVPRASDGFDLQWRANPTGTPPAAYKVYGSDERGFTASDTQYAIQRGKGFVRSVAEYLAKPANAPDTGTAKTPPNLIARTSATSLAVVGPDVRAPNTNKAYYRVVAVDAAGSESGPSDYAEVPRPFVFSRPEPKAQVGKPYRYEPKVIRSDGDLRCRAINDTSYNAAFWDREEHRFTAIRLPEGLTLDTATGVVSGKLARPGAFEVSFKVEDQFGKSRTVSYLLVIVSQALARNCSHSGQRLAGPLCWGPT